MKSLTHIVFAAVLTLSATFVFAQASVAITSPSGSEELKFFETIDITWENGGPGGK